MTMRSRLGGLAPWLGLVGALFALAAYDLAFSALGVVVDPRPAGLGLAAAGLLLATLGGVGLPAGRPRRRRLVRGAAAILAVVAAALLLHDLLLSYRTEPVRFTDGEISLAGTLYLPVIGEGPYAAVVVTHGSGVQTRYEGSYYARLFARHGIAALAYDKRGSGESGGDVERASYDELAADALAAVRFLAARSDVDGRRVGLWGVSEGGWVDPLAAGAGDEVAFVIVVSATADSPAQQVRYEVGARVRRAGFDAAAAERAMELYAGVSRFERSGEGRDELAAELEQAAGEPWSAAATYLPAKLPSFADLQGRAWYPAWRSRMDFDAVGAWRRVRCPVLVLNGGRDFKSDAASASGAIRDALAAGGNHDVTVRIYPRAEHGLVEWWLPDHLPPPRFPDGYPSLMVDWVRRAAPAETGGVAGGVAAPRTLGR